MNSLHVLDDEKDIKYWNFSRLSSPVRVRAKFAGSLSLSFPERQSFHEQRIPESGHQSLSFACPGLFFSGPVPIL